MHEVLSVIARRETVSVSGAEAAAYLQGQISQDVDALEAGGSALSFVLQPTGRVDSWFRIHRLTESEFTIDIEPGFGDALRARLERFLIHTRAEIGPVRPAQMVSIRGPVVGISYAASDVPGALVADVGWSEFAGIDLVWIADKSGAAARFAPDGSGDTGASRRMEEARIRAGVALLGAEILPGSVPAESGPALLAASVSFTKGCYTGQELVARMHNRGGRAPVSLRRLTADSAVGVGTEVVADGAASGVVTSSSGRFALARLSRRVDPGDLVSVGGAEAVVDAVPGDEVREPA